VARLFFLLTVITVSVFAETMLWKVSYGGKTLYLGGTVHVLRASDYPLPEAFEKAFASAGTLVFETDMGAMRSPQYAAALQERLMCGPGESLATLLDAKTYADVAEYARTQHVPMALLDRMKPPLAVVTLLNLKLQELGFDRPGVDLYFFDRASKRGKQIRWFERPEEQIAMLASIGREDVDGMVRQSLTEASKYETVMRTIIGAWRRGDAPALERLGKKYLMYESPEDYRRLIVKRNRRWMGKLTEMLRSRETELVLVGALHLVGPQGLIAQLKRRGYRVEQL
jgi:uncharacterized protein